MSQTMYHDDSRCPKQYIMMTGDVTSSKIVIIYSRRQLMSQTINHDHI